MKSVLQDAFESYVLALRQTPLDQHTEMTGRGALETLLNRFKPTKAIVTHEPKRAQTKGAPDFKVSEAGQVLGYLENKAVGENLDAVLKSDQIKKYQTLSGNIVLTDYLRWMWLKDGKVIADCRLGEAGLLEDRKSHLRPERVSEVQSLIEGFFSQAVTGISRAKPLAEALAVRSQLLRDFLGAELVRQEETDQGGQLIGLFGAFQKQVSHEITLGEFADAFAQTLAYGLFLAKLNDPASKEITLANAKTFIPQSVGLIRELVSFLDNLDRPEYADIAWVVEEVLSIINGIKLAELHEDLSFRNRKARRGTRAGSDEEWRLFSRDPFIYFYEDYLAKYDSKLRKSRGVYYTPPPVVNFIVRAIHDVLKDTFGIPNGLADRNRVTVLDFACGTGTFLVEVLERIFEEIGPDSGKAKQIVSDHILNNVFGFEYLIGPYTIAHLKLGQYLADKGHKLADDQRLQVYLTNTLEPIKPERNYLVPELSHETELAQEVKERPILVITGNPPYAGHSKNPSTRLVPAADIVKPGKGTKYKTVKKNNIKYYEVPTPIGEAIEAYKLVEEEDFSGKRKIVPLGEKNPKWLHDDYVKFIRFAQMKMDSVQEGVVGIITNHGFLDNVTFRGMRDSLFKSFDQIHIFDLHGSTKPRETAPAGSANENVFDIQKGVAISLLIKRNGLPKGVWRTDVWGTRQEKYEWAASAEFRSEREEKLYCDQPLWPFYPVDKDLYIKYYSHVSIRDVFEVIVLGYQTHRDHFAIDFEESIVRDRVNDLRSAASDASLQSRYNIADNRDWKLEDARDLANLRTNDDGLVIRTLYRPFDLRWCIFGHEAMDYPRRELLDHVANRENIQLLVPRQARGEWRHSLVALDVAESCAISDQTKEQNYNIPLYLFAAAQEEDRQSSLFGGADQPATEDKFENIKPEFRQWIDARYGHAHTPEEILGYVYAILHAPDYRHRYADFLRRDFPRIPFPQGVEEFGALSELGWALVQAHLMKSVPKRGLGAYRGKGDDWVEKPSYSPAERAVWINDSNFFADVPQAVWDFTIGGYQVVDKYLKSRKGRTLSLDEIENVESVINILDLTIDQMERIDARYRSAFGKDGADAD